MTTNDLKLRINLAKNPMMKLSILTFVITEDCNFSCTYCKQKKSAVYLTSLEIESFLSFVYPHIEGELIDIVFYGGEPLLGKEQIRQSVSYLQAVSSGGGRRFRYTITTNGSLLDDDIIEFFGRNHFIVYLSFDGPGQDRFRKSGSFASTGEMALRLARTPGIDVAVNCVITPQQGDSLATTVASLVEAGISKFRIALDLTREWTEDHIQRFEASLVQARRFLSSIYLRTGESPFLNFAPPPSPFMFRCDGGKDRLTLAPGPEVWGCHRAWEYFSGDKLSEGAAQFRFGDLDACMRSFDRIHPSIIPNYAILRHDFAHTPEMNCIDCPDVRECGICPFTAAASGQRLGSIPGWVCRLLKLQRRQRKLFLDENLQSARLNVDFN